MSELENIGQELKKVQIEIERLHSQLNRKQKKPYSDEGVFLRNDGSFVSRNNSTPIRKGSNAMRPKNRSASTMLYNVAFLWRLKKKINAQQGHKDNIGLPIKQIKSVLDCSKTTAIRYNKVLKLLELIQQEQELTRKLGKVFLLMTPALERKLEKKNPSER